MTPTQQKAMEMAIEALNSCRIMSVASSPAKEVTPKKITKAIEALSAALAEQADDKAESMTAEPKFTRGDRVRKRSGSQWQGIVVGEYSTKLTPEGYAVESEAHAGSVQIYPASALELVEQPNTTIQRPAGPLE